MITSEPAVPSALLLGLYPSNTLRILNKGLTRSRRVFSSVPKPSKRRKGSAGRVNNNRAHAGGGAGGPGPRHFLKNEQINVSTVERRILKTAPRALQYGEDAFFTRNTEVRNGRRGDDRRRTLPYGSHDYIYLLNKNMIVAVVIAI